MRFCTRIRGEPGVERSCRLLPVALSNGLASVLGGPDSSAIDHGFTQGGLGPQRFERALDLIQRANFVRRTPICSVVVCGPPTK